MTSLEEFFLGYRDTKYLFDTVLSLLKEIGNPEIKVSKSQIAFYRVRAFAWVWIPGKYLHGKTSPLVLTIALPYRDPSPRWKEVVEPSVGHFTHHLELFTNADIDSEVSHWLRLAWEQAS